MGTHLQKESLWTRSSNAHFVLCKATSIINGCSAAVRSWVLYLRYGRSLLCRAPVLVSIIALLAFMIILLSLLAEKRSPHCNRELWLHATTYYLLICFLNLTFNCTDQAAGDWNQSTVVTSWLLLNLILCQSDLHSGSIVVCVKYWVPCAQLLRGDRHCNIIGSINHIPTRVLRKSFHSDARGHKSDMFCNSVDFT